MGNNKRHFGTIKGMALNDSVRATFAKINTTSSLSASLMAQKKLSTFDSMPLGILTGIDKTNSMVLTTNLILSLL